MINVLGFVLANALVIAGAALAAALLRLSSAVDRVLAFLTLAAGQIVATLLIAGVVLRRFEPITVLMLNALVVGALATLVIRDRCLGEPDLRALRQDGEAAARAVIASPWLVVLLALAAAQAVWRIFAGWVLPPSGFDALWYHLTTVAWWLQSGVIGGNPFVLWSDVYPSDGELFAAWQALFLRSDRFVDLAQLPFAVMGALAVAGIARTIGLSTQGAAASGLIFFLTPIVLVEASAAYVDLVFAVGFLVGLYFLLRYFESARRDDPRLPFLAGLGGGLALGSKYVGAIYCGVLVVCLVAGLAARRTPVRALGTALTCFLTAALALGGFWYLRNSVHHGDPVYPFFRQPALVPGQRCDVCLGDMLRQWHQDQIPLVPFHRFNVDRDRGGLGPLWAYLAAPLAPVVFAHAVVRSRRLVWGLFVPVTAALALQPYRWWSRFTIMLMAVGAVVVVYAIERLPRRPAAAVKIVTVVLLVLGLSYSTPASSLLDALDEPSAQRTAASVSPPWFAWVDRLEPGSRIAADTTTESGLLGGGAMIWYFFPLFGDRFQHRVLPLSGRNDAAIARMLIHRRIGYVILGNDGPYARFARREAWRDCLNTLFRNDTVLVYGIERDCFVELLNAPARDRDRSHPPKRHNRSRSSS